MSSQYESNPNKFDSNAYLNIVKNRTELSAEDILRDFKLRQYTEYLNNHYTYKDVKGPELAKMMNTTMSSMNRIRKDLNAPSIFQYKVPLNQKSNHDQCFL